MGVGSRPVVAGGDHGPVLRQFALDGVAVDQDMMQSGNWTTPESLTEDLPLAGPPPIIR